MLFLIRPAQIAKTPLAWYTFWSRLLTGRKVSLTAGARCRRLAPTPETGEHRCPRLYVASLCVEGQAQALQPTPSPTCPLRLSREADRGGAPQVDDEAHACGTGAQQNVAFHDIVHVSWQPLWQRRRRRLRSRTRLYASAAAAGAPHPACAPAVERAKGWAKRF